MTKQVNVLLEWGSKLVSLVILIQQTQIYTAISVGVPYQLSNWKVFAAILLGMIFLLVFVAWRQKEHRFYLTSVFPLIVLILVLVPNLSY